VTNATNFLVRTRGTWLASRAREVEVDYQVNDQPLVRRPWAASAGHMARDPAIYKRTIATSSDFRLQSLPDGARLKNQRLIDGPGSQHERRRVCQNFSFSTGRIGMPIPGKIGTTACKWAQAATQSDVRKKRYDPAIVEKPTSDGTV